MLTGERASPELDAYYHEKYEDHAQLHGWDNQPKRKTMSTGNTDKGDFARSMNGAFNIVANDTKFVQESSPDQIVQAIGILTAGFYELCGQLIEELAVPTDPKGGVRDGRPASAKPSYGSNRNSTSPSSGGSFIEPKSEAQKNFFIKIATAAGVDSGPLLQYEGSYEERTAYVDELKVKAGWE